MTQAKIAQSIVCWLVGNINLDINSIDMVLLCRWNSVVFCSLLPVSQTRHRAVDSQIMHTLEHTSDIKINRNGHLMHINPFHPLLWRNHTICAYFWFNKNHDFWLKPFLQKKVFSLMFNIICIKRSFDIIFGGAFSMIIINGMSFKFNIFIKQRSWDTMSFMNAT